MNEIIRFSDIKFLYNENVSIIKDFNFEVETGDFLAILGPNGSGKSTLAKLVLGLEKVSSGDILVNDLSIKEKKNVREIRRKVGMILQNSDHQIINSIVEKDIAFAPENYGYSTEEINEMVDKALEITDLSHLRYKNVNELSSGEKQKVAIAGVLAMKPDVVILDESTAMLDQVSRINILEFLKKINKEFKTTIILITHNIDEIRYSNRCMILKNGKVIVDCPPLEAVSDVEKLKDLRIEVPQAVELVYELNKSGIEIPYKLHIEEVAEELCKLF